MAEVRGLVGDGQAGPECSGSEEAELGPGFAPERWQSFKDGFAFKGPYWV